MSSEPVALAAPEEVPWKRLNAKAPLAALVPLSRMIARVLLGALLPTYFAGEPGLPWNGKKPSRSSTCSWLAAPRVVRPLQREALVVLCTVLMLSGCAGVEPTRHQRGSPVLRQRATFASDDSA